MTRIRRHYWIICVLLGLALGALASQPNTQSSVPVSINHQLTPPPPPCADLLVICLETGQVAHVTLDGDNAATIDGWLLDAITRFVDFFNYPGPYEPTDENAAGEG